MYADDIVLYIPRDKHDMRVSIDSINSDLYTLNNYVRDHGLRIYTY
jgi:hypothetical protein